VNGKFVKIVIIAVYILLFTSFSAFCGPNAKARFVIDYDAYSELLDEECPDMGEDSEIVLSIIVKGVTDLDGYALLVEYNHEALSFVSAKKSLSGTGTRAFLESNGGKVGGFLVKPGEGSVDIAASMIGTSRDQAPDGSGAIVYLHFKRIQEGDCGIKIVEAELIDSGLLVDKIIDIKAAKAQKKGKAIKKAGKADKDGKAVSQ